MNTMQNVRSFQEKISDKIKESIGDLITDEDLKPLVEKSIEQLLTEDRIVPRGGSSYGNDTLPPLLQEILMPILRTQISKAVDAHIAEHPEIFTSFIEGAIKDGFLQMMIIHLNNRLNMPLMDFQQKVEDIFMKNNIDIS